MRENEYKEILSALLGLLNEGVHIVAGQGTSIFYNSVMARMEQMEPADVVGRRFEDAFSHMDLESSTIYRALQAGASTVNQPQRYINASGKYIHTINTTIPVKDADGKLLAVIEVANDVTQLSELCDRLAHLQSQVGTQETSKKQKLKRYHFSDLIGRDPKFQKSMERAKRAAQNDMPVLIYGETGTGKELFAQSIHYGGTRSGKPFIAQNCAALPSNLLEGLLFGTAKGGFTGAVDRAGLFELANHGTLLLDELNSMPYELQSKLLRVLQESYIRRVGGSEDIPVDVRVITTVNEDPVDLIRQGKLRQDLYYRLSVVTLNIPPLRERRGDIPYLAQALIEKHHAKMGKRLSELPRDVLRQLMEYDYPGNVRELENILIQAMFMMDGDSGFTTELLDLPAPGKAVDRRGTDFQAGESLQDYIERIEEETIRTMFDRCRGNVSQCAPCLHMKRQTLQHKLKKYGILY